MSKIAAIDVAVRLQLAEDGKFIGYNEKLNTLTGYTDKQQVQEFLFGIAKRLRLDTPSWIFTWSQLDPEKLLACKLVIVHGLIEANMGSA